MRHSDPKLTMKVYTYASQLELGNSLAKLPSIGVPTDQKVDPVNPQPNNQLMPACAPRARTVA